uniref:Uncharacterized protein n=1 Tax=Mola mola TaxID=94237 RepID=A0A3Q3WXR6_MOLML
MSTTRPNWQPPVITSSLCRLSTSWKQLYGAQQRTNTDTKAQADHPDEGTRNLGMARAALPARGDRMNNGQVSVKADAGQEKDTTVAVQGEEGTGDLANSQAEHPLVSPLHCKQGQSEGQHEVRNGQVKEECVCQ